MLCVVYHDGFFLNGISCIQTAAGLLTELYVQSPFQEGHKTEGTDQVEIEWNHGGRKQDLVRDKRKQ